jgi:hypothetical protein
VPADGAPATSAAPTPMPAAAPAPTPPAPPSGGQAVSLSGNYDSTRGPLSCTDSGTAVSCTFNEGGAQGRLDCTKDGSGLTLGCNWITFLPRPGAGRARLTRPSASSRDLAGSFGYLTSDSNGGSWNASPR